MYFLDNTGSISHILRLNSIASGSILLTAILVEMKKGNYEPILIVKRTEWRKFIDYFGLIIEADPSRVVKKSIYFFRIGYIPITSSVKLHVSRQNLDK